MARELIFDIFAIDRASAVFDRVGHGAEHLGSKFGILGAAAGVGVAGVATAAAAAVALGAESIHMAGNFEEAITRLTTTAGESPKNLKMVGDGLLAMAGQVGFSAHDLAVGMYTVESAGYHGADGLKVMEAAAKGARIEGADLGEVANAVSSLLVDYHLKADQAARVTNVLTAAVGHGKTTFQEMATALPNVAAAAASAHISMEEVSSAIATMTMHGTDAAKAGTYLRQVIGQLEGPSAKARAVMKGLGIDANQLGLTLSSGNGHGLYDAIKMVDDGIRNHMTPSGLVAIEMFKKSSGSISDYQKMLANLPPTYVTSFGALSEMVGGVKSLQGFLQLGGENLKTYAANVAAVRDQVKKGGKDVAGFAEQQATFNGKLNDAKGALSALAIKLGNDLLPYAKEFLDWFTRSLPTFERWAGEIRDKAAPVLREFGGWIKNDLWPALKDGYNTVLPGLKQAWQILTDGVGGKNGDTWKKFGDFITQDLIPVLSFLARYVIPAVAWEIHRETAMVQVAMDAMTLFKNAAVTAAVFVLEKFADLTHGIGMFLIALGQIPGFGWATNAGKAMLGASDAARSLAASLTAIKSPPPINIPIGVYGTSAVAAALIAGNAPLANSMMAANRYAGGGAYSTSATGSVRTNGGLRAAGGPVMPGMTYRVGENGPEDVTFGASGYVHDAKSTKARGNGGPLVHIDNYYEAKTPAGQVAADLMFRARTA